MMEIRATFSDKTDRTEQDIIQNTSRVPLLILDDLAAEKVSDYSVSTLYIILNRRGEQGKPTIITSNLTIRDVAEQMGDRIANRLVRYGKVITLKRQHPLAPLS
jgi:DNA replication protein DnaC